MTDPLLTEALRRLASRLEVYVGELRKRGRTRRLDSIGGLAIEPGDAEGILAELCRPGLGQRAAQEHITLGLASFAHARRCFELTPFDCDVLLLAMAPELDGRFCRLFGFLNDSVVALRPTVGLAIAALAPGPEALSRFLPGAPLVDHGLIVTEGDAPLAGRAIRVAADVWPRLAGLRAEVGTPPRPVRLTEVIAPALRAIDAGPAPVIAVVGDRAAEALDALTAALSAVEIDSAMVADAEPWAAAVRDARWRQAALVVRGRPGVEQVRRLTTAPVPVAVAIDAAQVVDLVAATRRPVVELMTAALDVPSRAALWRDHGAARAGADVDALAHRFRFTAEGVAAAMALARARASTRGEAEATSADVLAACRAVGAAGATKLAARLETTFEPEDLVVPAATRGELELFETAARRGHRLFGAGARGGAIRGAGGFIALFAGRPGTGKTMGAQIMARRLGVDLLRVDLSQVVNKYIGETEKHLDVVFREAETSGALLFFDEADALFGKRTEVKDAHDRYSNIETAYLLQRLEQHPGTAILATNLLQNLDAAFLRRLHFIVEFPLPTAAERRLIWERHLVREALASDVDPDFLARFELAGGDIRNAVVAAVLMSADEPRVGMRHLVIATSRELRKAGRLAQPDQFGRWRDDVLGHLRGAPKRVEPD